MSISKLPEIHIIYASTSGNVEWVCEQIAKRLKPKRFPVFFHRAEATSIDLIKENKFFIFATSTWEHGRINPFFDRLLWEIQKTKMDGKFAGMIGLGDSRYTKAHFCGGLDFLQHVFVSQGGKVMGIPLKMNGEPYEQMEKPQINIWFEKFISALKDKL